MRRRTKAVIRMALGVAWPLLVAAVIALSLAAQIAPRFDRQLFIVRGSSMEPAIPLGAVIIVAPLGAHTPAIGDIVTVGTGGSKIVTHRVIDVAVEGGETWLTTKGDASQVRDAATIAPAQVFGRVVGYVPVIGFVLAFLSLPSGMIAAVSLIGALMLMRWQLEGSAAAEPGPALGGLARPAGTVG